MKRFLAALFATTLALAQQCPQGYTLTNGKCVATGSSGGPGGSNVAGLVFTIGDPAGSALVAGAPTTDYLTVPFACSIKAYNLVVDAGTVTVKFWKVASGIAIPTAANSISTSGVSIASGTAAHSAVVTDFTTTTVNANDILAMNVTAVATAKYVQGVLQCQ